MNGMMRFPKAPAQRGAVVSPQLGGSPPITTSGIPEYPWVDGELLYAEALNAAIANAGGEANAVGYGADPTGVADSSAAINAALATGQNVYVPQGNYRLTKAVTVGSPNYSQRLRGAGPATILRVDYDFDPTALGVIVIGAASFLGPGLGNDSLISSEVANLVVSFKQPPDLQTTASASAAIGATTIAVASAAGITVGMTVVDHTNYDALSNALSGGNPYFTLVTVTAVAGTTITLSSPVKSPGVSSGDALYFGANRAMYQPLGTGTTTPGGTGVRYPWAIYGPSTGYLKLSGNILIAGAWNGVYIRGSAFRVDSLLVGALNVGCDIDNCHNFSYVGDYQFYVYGLGSTSTTDPGFARVQSFYDGTTIAMNLGAVDGGKFDSIQSWAGIVNLTSAFTWAEVDSIALDGNFSALNIAAGSSGTGWLQVGNLYKSCGLGQATSGILVNGFSGFKLAIGTVMFVTACSVPAIQITSGGMSIGNGTIYHGGPSSGIELDGDHLVVGPVQFLGGPQGNRPYINQTAGWLSVNGAVFATASTTNQPGISITDNAANVVRNIGLNGWGLPGVPVSPLGFYQSHERGITVSGNFYVDGAAGTQRNILLSTLGKLRWGLIAGTLAETGGNQGSNFWIFRYADDGVTVLSNPLSITRANGQIVLADLQASASYANDAAAAAGGVAVGALYRNGSIVQVRVA